MKELRLRGISDQDAGNASARCAPTAVAQWRFASKPHLARTTSSHEQSDAALQACLVRRRSHAGGRSSQRTSRRHLRERGRSIQIEYLGTELTARAFAKDAHVNPGAIVENKLLGHTLRVIADAQRERDQSRLDNQRMMLRDQDMLRRAMAAGFEDAAHERQYRVNKPPTYSAMRLAIMPPTHALDPQESKRRSPTGPFRLALARGRHPTQGLNGQWVGRRRRSQQLLIHR